MKLCALYRGYIFFQVGMLTMNQNFNTNFQIEITYTYFSDQNAIKTENGSRNKKKNLLRKQKILLLFRCLNKVEIRAIRSEVLVKERQISKPIINSPNPQRNRKEFIKQKKHYKLVGNEMTDQSMGK